MSSLVSKAANKVSAEEILKNAYREAERDTDRRVTLADWEHVDLEEWE